MQIALIEALEARKPEKAEAFLDLLLEDLEHALDAGRARRREPVAIEAADADRLGAKRDRLDDVGAAAEAEIDDDRARPATAATISGSTSIAPRP